MPLKNKKHKKEDDGGGSPAWMTTFGDMMTLLLVFFVLLYSFSSMDVEKFRGFISALQNQLGVLDGGQTITPDVNIDAGNIGEDFAQAPENIQQIMQELDNYIESNNLGDKVNVENKRKGLVISLTGEILYELGKADIREQGKEVLAIISNILIDIPNDIMIEGHTDDLPIRTDEFPSNWELSTARAVNVIKFLIEERNFNPARLSAAGYSEYRPVANNNTAEGRAKNRRVEVVVLNSQYNEGGS
ncbi:chemotaxis protein MotB [Halanaerobium congolense]|jgi:chemotaxis protein MotB|uniref:Chemotaxis protein MotB n=1 Tax=Halanaerobium congolense TaxID=54121 RepID=A0A1G6S4F6_9FIRM|nr:MULTISPECIES: flagellar motor protein MotB [Halanaerobium]KXS49957.1 MAG: chemotaxis protein MotB [Halanaerobium sp. T82-1]PUU92312.1 MAG: chemotaxis protein MotB [Halanaerobium sp.]PUU92489.1 MAG: chemotaxis protein MotB [Halanaerobium sp.]TDP26342.1 chemotaxis protein MotB [Halanaerobium congolense]TDS34724.1 chemotaxis protein MotB [Halanaerobium congolense]